MREAIANVKRELGPEAVILSCAQARKGLLASPVVEVTAALGTSELDGNALKPEAPTPRKSAQGARIAEGDVERIIAPLKAEMRSLRSLVKQQSENDDRGIIRNEISSLKKMVVQELQRLAEVSARASANLPPLDTIAANAALAAPSTARSVAVVGASGVGKTTTIAKLACTDALITKQRVALLTLDVYRVGAVQQIQAYADLIGIPLEVVDTPSGLASALRRHASAGRIYIDTGGGSPSDLRVQNAFAAALHTLPDLEVHLALPAASTGNQIDEALARYRPLEPARLIFTKCDEASDLRELVYTPARVGIPVCHITMGQRVPEDLEAATAKRLLELAARGQAAFGVAA
jgi:flagellar biosynthesis protein FlhF